MLRSQELMRRLKTLKWQSELAEQKQKLLEDRIRLKEENEELRKAIKDCEGLLREMHNQTKTLVKGAAKLEKEMKDFRAQSQ